MARNAQAATGAADILLPGMALLLAALTAGIVLGRRADGPAACTLPPPAAVARAMPSPEPDAEQRAILRDMLLHD